jgi:glycosyltransferase domain-containing protein
MDNNFSILLVLKDRPHYTVRYMGYLNHIKFPYKIIIADGGKNLEIQNILENKKNYSNLNYEYIRFPYDETLNDFYEKMAMAVEQIESPTVSVMDNDDFILLEGIPKCLHILKENEHYSSSRGAILSIAVSHDVFGYLSVGKNMYSKYPNSIIGETAVDRMIDQTKKYHGNWHNVARSNHTKALWAMINVAKPQNMRFIEQLTGYLNTIWGDSHRSDFPFMLHQHGQRIETQEGTLASHFPDQEVWINSDFWIEDFNKMTEVVGVGMALYDNIPVEEAMEKFANSYHYKLPHLKDLLEKKIEECKKVGYNKDRIKKLFEVLRKYKVKTIDKIGDIKESPLSAREELGIMSNVLLNPKIIL